MRSARTGLLIVSLAALGALACDEGSALSGEPDAATTSDTSDTGDTGAATAPDVTPDITIDVAIDAPAPDIAFDPSRIAVGPNACCLTMNGERAIWSEDGDLWMIDLANGRRAPLVIAAGVQKDPVLEGDRLVWADSRGGDFDLWTLTFDDDGAAGSAALLRGGPGDQDEPALSGARLVWIGRDAAPHTALEAEVWTLELGAGAHARSERRLTFDAAEQTQPDVDGDTIVWADFTLSPAARYLPENDPLKNNADILGIDLATDEALEITRDLSKQLRPAIDGDVVAWLDWRGINPEPKYSEFQVYVRRFGELVERRLAWSSWDRPELWRRPAVSQGVVVFIAEPTAGTPFVTSVLAVSADGGEPWLVAGSPSVLDSVVVDGGHAAWIGGGTLGVKALTLGP
ncbi:MAG: hypothetical protein IT385_25360 [Deltaproteobacteria bacterium]|nr:hypothetical protein [Deltaproteobacteria bacterium]